MRGQEAFETTAARQEQGERGRTKGPRVSRICGLDFLGSRGTQKLGGWVLPLGFRYLLAGI